MAIYTFRRAQTVQMSIEECWRFFSDPRNLAKITPPSLRFNVRSELPEEIYAGLMIRYTISPLWNLPMTWLTEITQVQKPVYFADDQRVGPYRIWHHEHFFHATGAEKTEVRDLVHYVPPLGPFGAMMNALVIRRQIERIFDFRRKKLEEICAGRATDSEA
ncbi:MAG: SRPBCC family protein [Verrucomicrobiota bacterium]|nr:SRPBCC family protein [Verrucomicrobiota bacterium]